MNFRVLLAIVVAALVGLAVWALSRTPPAEVPHPPATTTTQGTTVPPGTAAGPRETPFQSSDECRACHEDVWREWKGSYHGMAWTDPMVQELTGGFTQTECIDCHAPLPIHVTGVKQRVAPRRHSRADGVDCITCHLLEDGVSVAATRAVNTSATPGACRPQFVDTMDEVDACAGCHDQHETVGELLASGVDKVCSDCHMEPATREGGRAGRSHVFPGGHDLAMHRRAAKLDVAVEGGEVVAKITNVGAGHKIPTDARHRSYNLWITAVDEHGNVHVDDLPMPNGEARLYYRDAFKPSTQVAHGQSLTAKWPLPKNPDFRGKVVVRLTYALNPNLLKKPRELPEVARAEVTVP